MPSEFDVIVIGAGPAGCGAAYDLAAAGQSVLLLDKKDFPRLKPCAGALTIKALRALRYPVTPVVRHVCRELRLDLGTGRSVTCRGGSPVAAMTVRSEFDAFCLEQCRQRGAEFRRVRRVDAIGRAGDGSWAVSTPEGSFRGGYLVGADGANSQLRRTLAPRAPVRFGVALEACVPTARAGAFAMQFDFGAVERGYGWVFPKGDHLNVGLYTLAPTIRGAADRLAAYCRAKTGLTLDAPIHGHKVAHGGRRFRHAAGGAMLVGDAAGFMDPFLGEGIHNAIRSGQLAAAAILDLLRGGADTYGRRVREVSDDLASYHWNTELFYRKIERGYRLLTFPPVRHALFKGFALGWTVSRIRRQCLALPFVR